MRLTFILCIALLYISCKTSNSINDKILAVDKTDSVKVNKLISQKISQLEIKSLENGFDSIQIRIWYEYSLLKERDLVILELSSGLWKGSFYEMVVDWNPSNFSEKILSKKIKSVTPKSGWPIFLNKLSELKITSLPNMSDIPGLTDNWDDGTTYTVEVAIGKKYRTYSYHVPKEFQNSYWSAENMVKILEIISNELNVSR